VRYLAIAVVCLAVGFGAGWLTFDWPFASGPSRADVARAVGAHAGGDVRFTKCDRLASPANVWTCSVYRPDGPGLVESGGTFRATVNGSAINVENGQP
jgi:hypothetical protein